MSGNARSGVIRFGEFEVDLAQHEVRRLGRAIPLQHKPFQILELLVRSPGSLITREEISRYLWPDSHVSVERCLNTAVNNLRQALGDSSHGARLIATRPGLGYVFIGRVEETARHQNDVNEDYLKGRYLLDKLTEEDTRKAIAYFESAASQTSGIALAYSGLADAECELARLSLASMRTSALKAKNYSSLAMSSNAELAESHVALARVKMLFDRDWKGAQSEFLQALELNPDCAAAQRFYASLLMVLREKDIALRHIRRAQSIEPLSLPIGVDMAWCLYLVRNYEGAVEQCWKILALEPRFWAAQMALGLAYAQLGLKEESATELENAVNCSGYHPMALAALATRSADAIQIFFGCIAASHSTYFTASAPQ